ncbi:MAG TPA: hypothetical protein VII75_08340 [Thermoanaerobaculia bacterium]|nr:hypothetical protein [Thermoanaerobaculia bacterium]
MFAFVIGDFFRRRRRGPRYERDEMPEGPLLQVAFMWLLLAAGGLLGAFAIASFFLELGWSVAIPCALLSPLCFWQAMRLWWRLTR